MSELGSTTTEPGRPQYSLGCLLLVVLLVALPLGAVTVLQRMRAKDPPRPLYSQAEWPQSLREFAQAADERDIAVLDSKVYLLQKFWSEEALWQTRATPELLEEMISKWQLTPAGAKEISSFRANLADAPQDWYTPSAHEQPVYYASFSGFIKKSDNFIVMHAPKQGMIVVWYYFNF